MLGALSDVGLGYVRLGQPLTTLSGGERQRIKLAIEVDRSSAVLVLDEPTTGLHVVAGADWVIDMGPGPGHDGGEVVFEGSPRALLEAEGSLTGRHLKEHLAR